MTTTNRRYSFKKKNTLKHFVRPIAGVPTILNNKNLLDDRVPLIIAANRKLLIGSLIHLMAPSLK